MEALRRIPGPTHPPVLFGWLHCSDTACGVSWPAVWLFGTVGPFCDCGAQAYPFGLQLDQPPTELAAYEAFELRREHQHDTKRMD